MAATSDGRLARLRRRHAKEERAFIRAALRGGGWMLPGTAEWLGVPIATLQYLIVKHGIASERERRRPKEGSLSGGHPGEERPGR